MLPRERIVKALSPDGSPEIPAVIIYEGIMIRDHWAALTRRPWWHAQAPDVETQAAWRVEFARLLGQDWYYLPSCAPRQRRMLQRIDVRADGVYLLERRLPPSRLEPPRVGGWGTAGQVESLHPTHAPQTPAQVDELLLREPLDPRHYLCEGRADLAAVLRRTLPDLYPIRHISAPYWRCYALWGFEGLMALTATNPDLVAHACRMFLDRALDELREALLLGAQGIFIEDCLTDMLSPAAYARLNAPYLRELTDAIRAAGLQSIYYYCGNPHGKWEQLLEVGADALALEESKKGFVIDIEDVVERVDGRCALLGNLDAIELLPSGSEAQLRAEVARQVAVGRAIGGRFVASIGSPVTPGCSVERVQRFLALAHGLGARA